MSDHEMFTLSFSYQTLFETSYFGTNKYSVDHLFYSFVEFELIQGNG